MVWLTSLMWGGCAETQNGGAVSPEVDLSTASLALRFLEQCEAEDVNGVMLLELHPPPEGSEIAGLKDASGKPLVKEHWRAEVATAHAFCAMFNLAHDEDFGYLNLHSGFRVSGDQEHLHCCHTKCKKGGKNGCKPGCDACGDPCGSCAEAAPAGDSHHEMGLAVDITTTCDDRETCDTPVYVWLINNAWRFGFKDTVDSEPWHWVHQPTVDPIEHCCSDAPIDAACQMEVLRLEGEGGQGESAALKSGKEYVIEGGETWSSGCASFHRYNCIQERATCGKDDEAYCDQGGPEVVYGFWIDKPGVFSAEVEPDVGDGVSLKPHHADSMDPDIHLLSKLSADHCLTRDHDRIGPVWLEPGPYYIVVDTRVDHGQGPVPRPLLARYRLEVTYHEGTNSGTSCAETCLGNTLVHPDEEGQCQEVDCGEQQGSCVEDGDAAYCSDEPVTDRGGECRPFCYNNVAYDSECRPTDCDKTGEGDPLFCVVTKTPHGDGSAEFAAACEDEPAGGHGLNYKTPVDPGSTWPGAGAKESDGPLCTPECAGDEAIGSDCSVQVCSPSQECRVDLLGEPGCEFIEPLTCVPQCEGDVLIPADCIPVNCLDQGEQCVEDGPGNAACVPAPSCTPACDGSVAVYSSCEEVNCAQQGKACQQAGEEEPECFNCPLACQGDVLIQGDCTALSCADEGEQCVEDGPGNAACVPAPSCTPACDGTTAVYSSCEEVNCAQLGKACQQAGEEEPECFNCPLACQGDVLIQGDCTALSCADQGEQCVEDGPGNAACVPAPSCTPACDGSTAVYSNCEEVNCAQQGKACQQAGAEEPECFNCPLACQGDVLIQGDCTALSCADQGEQCVEDGPGNAACVPAPPPQTCTLKCVDNVITYPDCSQADCGDQATCTYHESLMTYLCAP